MKKSLAVAMAAITFAGAAAITASPAEARGYSYGHGGYYHGGYYGHDRGGTALAAGVVGLALGAALASGGSGHGHNYYSTGYYPQPYYAPAYRVCDASHWVWDPYAQRNVWIRSEYAC